MKKTKTKKTDFGLSNSKKQAVKLAIDQIQKQFGRGAIMRLGEGPTKAIDKISTGILPLDFALGVGGLPRGRVVEIFGKESSGKTTICLSLIAEAQKAGGVAAFIDAEHAFDPAWARLLGVKLEDMLISQPDTGEQALEIAEQLIRSGGVDLVVVDSVAALVPRAEIEGDMGQSQMGLQARLMSQALRKLTGVISKSKTLIVFTNQVRMKIGIMFGNPETTPGGLAMKFYSSIRLNVRKVESLRKNNQIYGAKIKIKVVKNKVAPPFKEAHVVITAEGIDKMGGVVDVAIERGVFSRSGSFIKLADKVLGQGKEQVKELLSKDKKLLKSILDKINHS